VKKFAVSIGRLHKTRLASLIEARLHFLSLSYFAKGVTVVKIRVNFLHGQFKSAKMASMPHKIRLVTPADAPAILEIYAPYVENTVITFETITPTVAEMEQRINNVSRQFPWLVWEENNTILGYVYACTHRQRIAYQWSVELAVYIREGHHGKGIGKALYQKLFALLRSLGYYNAYAGVSLPNAGSVALHESMGMKPLAVYHKIGYKLGRWVDVGWWEIELLPKVEGQAPKDPLPFNAKL
jgi:phosphinothricin acetyltransferase